jgi:hypothetical protein
VQLWASFVELIGTPFLHAELVWGIGPLYFGWVFNELTSAKRSFRTAIQTGFSFLWAGAHWAWQHFQTHPPEHRLVSTSSLLAVNAAVTVLVLVIGLLALLSGLRKKYPRYGSFLGHTRFSNYFMIAIFPIQSRYLEWSWERLLAILVFALPIWLLFHFGLAPLRK